MDFIAGWARRLRAPSHLEKVAEYCLVIVGNQSCYLLPTHIVHGKRSSNRNGGNLWPGVHQFCRQDGPGRFCVASNYLTTQHARNAVGDRESHL